MSKARSLGPGPARPCALGKVTRVPGAWEGVKWFPGTFLHVEALQRLSAHAGTVFPPTGPQTRPPPAVQLEQGPQPSQHTLLLLLAPSLLVLAGLVPTNRDTQPLSALQSGVGAEPALRCDLHRKPPNPHPSLNFLSVECREVYRAQGTGLAIPAKPKDKAGGWRGVVLA